MKMKLDESKFKNRLRTLMYSRNLNSAADLAKALYDKGIITVSESFDDNSETKAKSSMARRIQDHLKWDDADRLQGIYVTAYCDFFGCSADYLFGRTNIKSGNPKVVDFCNATGLSEKSVKRLIEDLPQDIKKELVDFWSNVLESNVFYGVPLEYHQMCYELGQYQAALRQIDKITEASNKIEDGTTFAETWRTMMTENYLKEAEPHKGAYYLHLNEIIENIKAYLDLWSDEYISKKKQDIDMVFFEELERRHQKSHDEFMKKMHMSEN